MLSNKVGRQEIGAHQQDSDLGRRQGALDLFPPLRAGKGLNALCLAGGLICEMAVVSVQRARLCTRSKSKTAAYISSL
ncbi:MAG TPA: hypothetical protein VKK81_04460 [Candidatus Binatia bacterium]|nr:hypothetical protein [Candidatus Binatia bacterium]